jgi:hypothetical protein
MRLTLLGLVIALIATVMPGLAMAGNQEVAQEIAGQLKASGQLSDYQINIRYENGVCKLLGRVNSVEQKVAAEAIARKVADVQNVSNELTVAPSANAAKKPAVQPAQYQPQPPRVAQSAPALPPAQAQRLQNAQAQMAQPTQQVSYPAANAGIGHHRQMQAGPTPAYIPQGGAAPVRYDQPHMPNHAWPSYAPYPNYAAVTYPRQYSASAWPYIGPFYPYPQVPLGWRKVTLEWDDGWWMLDFKD